MDINAEKKQIINGIIEEKDEWVLKAIKKLLDLDYGEDISDEHKNILNDRIADYKTNPADFMDWENFKKNLLNDQQV
ncbi:hypothetical protein BH11BAC5_BH11BAC5_24790 [soil metagenome]|jgi:transposase